MLRHAANDETLPVTEYAIRKLSTYNLSHLLLMGNTTDFSGTPLEKLADDGMFRHFRPLYKGTLIANVKTVDASHTRHRSLWVGLWLEKNAPTRFGN